MKKAFVFLLILNFTLSKNAISQIPTYVWAKTTTGNVESIQRATVVDAAGNVFISGVFFGTVDFDPGAGVTNVTPVPYGCNIYIAKYDASGNFLWIKNIPIIASYGHNSMAIDGSGNIYITGFFSGTNLDFNPGAGSAFLTSIAGGNDIYIAKYDNNGNYLWAKSIGSSGSDRGNEILTDPSGNVFVTGNFASTVDFDPGIGIANLSASGTLSIFLAKYDCNGNYLWAKNIDGAGSADVRDIALSPTGNIYLTGNYSASVDFDPGMGISNLTSVGNVDIFFAKYDPVGNLLWAKSIGSTGIDGGTALAVTAMGDVFITGTFNLTADFDAGAGLMNLTAGITANSYITKYDASGNYQWVKNYLLIPATLISCLI
ncbi:MAG: SBBP repeat-containing protein [Bacteroidetes bacterium]|nr:SBBP repeat-containing protein [Bacteroidota bacterium]